MAVADKCAEMEVSVINVGTQERTSQRAVEIAQRVGNCYAIIGLHPIHTEPGRHDEAELGGGSQPFISKGEVFDKNIYRELAKSVKVVGIGECGFDYYHTTPSSYPAQEEAFIAQIELANELSLPLMIHTRGPRPGNDSPTGRSVYQDVYEILKQYAKVPGNVHFYAGTEAEASHLFELGFTVSFTGVITFAQNYCELVKNAPLDLIHAETDCPYVAPIPYRGRRCEPWMVAEVYKKIAEIKGLDEEVVRAQLIQNSRRLYGLS